MPCSPTDTRHPRAALRSAWGVALLLTQACSDGGGSLTGPGTDSDAAPLEISVGPSSVSILETLQHQFTAVVRDARGAVVPAAMVTWESSDSVIAVVGPGGLVTAKAEGNAVITAKFDSAAASANVTVTPASFSQHVQPLFTARCALSGCHIGADAQRALDLSEGNAYDGIVGVPAAEAPLSRIEPSAPNESYLIHKLQGTQASVGGYGQRMPLGGPDLSSATIDTLRAWVTKGAANN